MVQRKREREKEMGERERDRERYIYIYIFLERGSIFRGEKRMEGKQELKTFL